MHAEAQKALNKAKIQMMTKPDSVFFTVVCFSLIHKWDTTIPTACTNGKYIKFNPDFFLSLSPDEQVFLVLHETLHVAFMHMLRLHTYNPMKWNHAADYVINDLLIQRGYKMPQGGLHDIQYRDMSVKQVYDLLPEPPPDSGFSMDLIPGDGDGKDPVAAQQAERDIAEIILRAATQAKMAGQSPGSIPGEIEFYLNSLLNPKLPWGTILKRYVSKLTKHDYTFRKPNRRFFPAHHLPSQHSKTMCDIAVAVDTSGSVSDEDFQQFMSEVANIIRSQKPEKLSLIQFDYDIKSVDVLKKVSDIKNVTFTGRGGTNIEPILEWAQVNKPHLLLVFTDGGFRQVDIPVKSHLIWVIHNNPSFTGEQGKTIHYEV